MLLGSAGGGVFQYVDSTTQNNGPGIGSFTSTVPVTVQNGDTVVLVIRKDGAFTAQPSGFNEEESYNFFGSSFIAVSTGVYNSGTHGSTLTWTFTAGTVVGVCYYIRGASTNPAGFVTAFTTGNDQFFPTVTAPSGRSFVIAFAYANAQMTDIQLAGFTQRYHAIASGALEAFDQMVSVSGSVTMVRWDSVANEAQVAFYIVPA